MSSPAGAGATAGAGAAGSSSCGGGGVKATVPKSLTREKLKEVMEFNATLLEKELAPIKAEMARLRAAGRNPQVDTGALLQLQGRISQQVHARHGVTDEQVMAAVEKYGAREDPAFKDILQRIATTLHASLQ